MQQAFRKLLSAQNHSRRPGELKGYMTPLTHAHVQKKDLRWKRTGALLLKTLKKNGYKLSEKFWAGKVQFLVAGWAGVPRRLSLNSIAGEGYSQMGECPETSSLPCFAVGSASSHNTLKDFPKAA